MFEFGVEAKVEKSYGPWCHHRPIRIEFVCVYRLLATAYLLTVVAGPWNKDY